MLFKGNITSDHKRFDNRITQIFGIDYPLVQAATLYLAVVFVMINLVVDVLYAWLDPRIKLG